MLDMNTWSWVVTVLPHAHYGLKINIIEFSFSLLSTIIIIMVTFKYNIAAHFLDMLKSIQRVNKSLIPRQQCQ